MLPVDVVVVTISGFRVGAETHPVRPGARVAAACLAKFTFILHTTMKFLDDYAWTPILEPLTSSDEPLTTWISDRLNKYLDNSTISRYQSSLWHLEVKDDMLKRPDLVRQFQYHKSWH